VTVRQGSRDGLAGRARRDYGAGRNGDGDDRGGDPAEGDDGPELAAMRSVWLAMRDEDPPERGLAELLAAAGAKAQAMQARPAWWQRLAAGLRRPPALALATVLMLVGGAVVVGRHGVDAPVPVSAREPSGVVAADPAVSVTPPVGSSRADGSFAEGQTTANPAPAAEATAAKVGAGAGSPGDPVPPEATVKPEVAVRYRVTPGGAPAAPAGVAPEEGHRAADAEPVVTTREATGGFTGDTVKPPAPPAHVARKPEPTLKAPSREAPAPAPAPSGASSSDDLAGTARASHNAPPPPADTEDGAKQAGKKAGNAAKDDEATSTARDKSGPSPGASIDQLYKQCEAAARRGDCAAVRRLVMRITARDRGYRARLAQESPVGKCLADPAE
jgi:hypothetical protein